MCLQTIKPNPTKTVSTNVQKMSQHSNRYNKAPGKARQHSYGKPIQVRLDQVSQVRFYLQVQNILSVNMEAVLLYKNWKNISCTNWPQILTANQEAILLNKVQNQFISSIKCPKNLVVPWLLNFLDLFILVQELNFFHSNWNWMFCTYKK